MAQQESPEMKARRIAAERSVSGGQIYGSDMSENEIMEEIQRLELRDYETERDTTWTSDAAPWKAAKTATLGAAGGIAGGLLATPAAPVTGGMSVPVGVALGSGAGLALDAITNIPIDMAGQDADRQYLEDIGREKKDTLRKIGQLKEMLRRIRSRKERRLALAASFSNTRL